MKPWAPYVDQGHDPESVVHVGVLPPWLGGGVALADVVLHDGAVSEQVSEVVNHLGAVARVVPTARL